MNIQPFSINVAQGVLDDVHERLTRMRWPDEVQGASWEYGTNLNYLKSLVAYWQHHFDWRRQETALNQFAHFRAQIGSFGIHFIHEHGRGPNPLPLIITHGWPGSFVEMVKIIPMLTDPGSHGGDPSDAFDVVAPSLPGFGFSDRPTVGGMTLSKTAKLWARLMTEGLGYTRFAAAGGDIGSGVTQNLALAYPAFLVGIHLTYLGASSQETELPDLSKTEKQYLFAVQRWMQQEGAYEHLQATKPQTLAYGLNDSPVGLAAWMIEKFCSWSDCDGEIERRFSKDELLTNIMIYWATETLNSSIRTYYENAHASSPLKVGQYIDVPTGFALFPKEIETPPREWAERTLHIQHWTQMPRGGHFAALEEPELLAEDIRAFFRPLRPLVYSRLD